MPKYDVIIKSHNKDYMKLRYVIDSIKYLVPQPENIVLISPDKFIPVEYITDDRIIAYRDEEVLPTCDRNKFRYRPNWCYASTMAVFQDVTPNDYFFDMQSDNFFVKEFRLFSDEDKPIFFVSPQHKHFYKPYFDFNKKMFGVGKKIAEQWGIMWDDSFIIDFMMYRKSFAKEILDLYGGIDGYFARSCEIIDENCHPSEQDLFPFWVLSKHSDAYEVQKDVQIRITGKDYPNEFTAEEIEKEIEAAKATDVVAVSCHTWKMEYPLK